MIGENNIDASGAKILADAIVENNGIEMIVLRNKRRDTINCENRWQRSERGRSSIDSCCY